MPAPLIETKLFAPVRREGTVARSRLIAMLERGARSKVTLVSAPPGFGKSTLLADWLGVARAEGRALGWVSLDGSDNDAASFWMYLVAALQRAIPDAEALTEGGDPRPGPTDVATAIVNALAGVPSQTVLVLDDYHVIEEPAIHEGVSFLIDHLPSNVHVVIATRADPPLPLARLRARGELVEIRAGDLRFSQDEAAAYLNGPMALGLHAPDIAALEGRTEGWIAALQLAALSMTGRADAATFIADFAGDDRYIVDYLVEEVLERQPPRVREFLLQTSILGRLTGTLCDAVTGGSDGKATLDALDRANLFLIALDDRRRWYRYHHLFGDVLQARLLDEQPEVVAALHDRASAWFERNGDLPEAVGHALAASNVERAADLIEVAAHDLRVNRQEQTLRRWLDVLPDAAFDDRPMLAMVHVGALLQTGETRHVEDRLEAAERWIAAARGEPERNAAIAAGMIVRRTDALSHLPSQIALHRAGLATFRGDVTGTIANARLALDAAEEGAPLERGAAAGILALAQWASGDLEAAHQSWSQSAASLAAAGHHADALGVSIGISDVERAQGRLHAARRTLERGLRIGTEAEPPLRGTADMHVGLAELDREANDLVGAAAHLAASLDLGEANGLPQNAYRQRVATARLRVAEGDLDAAVELLDEASRRYDGDFFPDVRPIAAVRARVQILQGRLDVARAWAEAAGIAATDEPTYLREFEHATLARLLVAEGSDAGVALSERLVAAAEAGQRSGSAVDILVVLALALHARGHEADALAALDRAIAIAEPEGFARVFLDEGPPMAALLTVAVRRPGASAYSRALLAGTTTGARVAEARRQPLIEQLSDRELEVLRLLASDLDGPEIARELYVSVNTLRTHTKNIFAKLGVNSRRAAVSRATELGLLGNRARR
ncbi:MAG TPA: LuxR C-terminal-related transcriptional regulator [Candidatus Limnocylindrales bacterium]|nr:LuxR C-terminal-related transcriptional regulator [Candidatus Limnocylindrales bacterium]